MRPRQERQLSLKERGSTQEAAGSAARLCGLHDEARGGANATLPASYGGNLAVVGAIAHWAWGLAPSTYALTFARSPVGVTPHWVFCNGL